MAKPNYQFEKRQKELAKKKKKEEKRLRKLAEKYYGDPSMWERIYEANPDKIERGLPIEGTTLTIPKPATRPER